MTDYNKAYLCEIAYTCGVNGYEFDDMESLLAFCTYVFEERKKANKGLPEPYYLDRFLGEKLDQIFYSYDI